MRAWVGIVVLACVSGCHFDATGGGDTGSGGVESTSGEPVTGSTSGGDTTSAAASTSVGVDGTTSGGDATSSGEATTVAATMEGGSSSSDGGEPALELCDGLDNDGDGAIDEPSPANLECEDCTSIIMGNVAFATCTDETSWEAARARCQLLGGDLASFDELDQQEDVVESGSGDRWIGLTDDGREGEWTWADGEPLEYEDWRAQEPDDGGPGEDCGQIRGIDGGWGDAVCGTERDYVCEVEVE